MIDRLNTYLTYGSSLSGLEHSSQNGKDIIYVTELKRKKSSLEIKRRFEVSKPNELNPKLTKNQPLSLIINNDQVLSKSIISSEINPFKILSQTFPNLNIEEFYYEIIFEEHIRFISICRKSIIKKLLNEYKNSGFFIVHLSLGNNAARGIIKFVEENELLTSNSKLTIKNKVIINIEKEEISQTVNYNLNGLETNNFYLLSSSGALINLLHNFQPKTNFNEVLNTLKTDYNQKRFFILFSRAGSVFILLLLLINFGLFSFYYSEVQKMQQSAEFNSSTKKKILEINQKVSKSQKMVEDMLKASSSKSSYYLNALAQNLPEPILLSDFNYQPVKKRVKDGEAIQISPNIINIAGTTTNGSIFSNWLAELERFNWINKVQVLSYEDLKLESKFSLKMEVHDE